MHSVRERFVKFLQPGSVANQHAKPGFICERPGGLAISPAGVEPRRPRRQIVPCIQSKKVGWPFEMPYSPIKSTRDIHTYIHTAAVAATKEQSDRWSDQ
jgi:hypothetical protein